MPTGGELARLWHSHTSRHILPSLPSRGGRRWAIYAGFQVVLSPPLARLVDSFPLAGLLYSFLSTMPAQSKTRGPGAEWHQPGCFRLGIRVRLVSSYCSRPFSACSFALPLRLCVVVTEKSRRHQQCRCRRGGGSEAITVSPVEKDRGRGVGAAIGGCHSHAVARQAHRRQT